jgi:hypothetical protein
MRCDESNGGRLRESVIKLQLSPIMSVESQSLTTITLLVAGLRQITVSLLYFITDSLNLPPFDSCGGDERCHIPSNPVDTWPTFGSVCCARLDVSGDLRPGWVTLLNGSLGHQRSMCLSVCDVYRSNSSVCMSRCSACILHPRAHLICQNKVKTRKHRILRNRQSSPFIPPPT